MTRPTSNGSHRSSHDGDAQPGDLAGDPETQAPRSSVFFARSIFRSRAYYFDSKLRLLPGATLPMRSMLVETSKQQILISPVGTPEESAQIDGSPILVAPSLLHRRHLVAAVGRYRPLALWGPPGLSEQSPALGPVHVFGVDTWPHGGELAFVLVEGAPRCNEVVFFHRASRTIYTANLFLNVCEPEGFLGALALGAMGIHRRFATPKRWRRRITDPAGFARSIDQILSWNFDRIVVAHGEAVDQHARAQFESALRELRLIE